MNESTEHPATCELQQPVVTEFHNSNKSLNEGFAVAMLLALLFLATMCS